MDNTSGLTANTVVDVLIDGGFILPEYRSLAIKELDHELRRRTQAVASNFARYGAGFAARKVVDAELARMTHDN